MNRTDFILAINDFVEQNSDDFSFNAIKEEILRTAIFYKYLSDRLLIEVEQYKQEKDLTLSYDELLLHDEHAQKLMNTLGNNLGYIIEPQDLFDEFLQLINKGRFDVFLFERALYKLEDTTLDYEKRSLFKSLFEHINFSSNRLGVRLKERTDNVAKIFLFVNETLKNVELSDYAQFFDTVFEKETGSFGRDYRQYLPISIIQLMGELVGSDKRRENLYDPFMGTGSLAAQVADQLNIEQLYGQEWRKTQYNLVRENVIIHNIQRSEIVKPDFLEFHHFEIEQFDSIVTTLNDMNYSNFEEFAQDRKYAKMKESSLRDELRSEFIEHIVDSLADEGIAVILMPRIYMFTLTGDILEDLFTHHNLVDCIIELPENALFNDRSTSQIIILKKNRDNADNILMIDASRNYIAKNNIAELNEHHINQVINVYKERKEELGFSAIVPLKEVNDQRKRGFLKVSDFITVVSEYTYLNPQDAQNELEQIDNKIAELEQMIDNYIAELNILN